ncbi:MAG: hypothetical protein NVSMB53_14310 [Gemmatimonadaceae bacterium]
MAGYADFLNLDQQPHHTVFLVDFDLAADDQALLTHALSSRTTPHVVRLDRGFQRASEQLREEGVEADYYVSFHSIMSRYDSLAVENELFASFARHDLARLTLPYGHMQGDRVSQMIRVMVKADYAEQRRIAARFFQILSRRVPYQVSVHTGADAAMAIDDEAGWFDLSGPLHADAVRQLPGGEVAYVGDCTSGIFVADGAILATPESDSVSPMAESIARFSGELPRTPVRLEITSGRVVSVSGGGPAGAFLEDLFRENERYRTVTEVGIAFNGACREFIHDWAAPSNEARPGVHVGIGGDPDRREATPQLDPIVHIDFMAANCEVFVNGVPFLRASSQ